VIEILRGLVDSVLIRNWVAGGVGKPCVGGVFGTNPDLSPGSGYGMVHVGAAGSRRTTGAGKGHFEGDGRRTKRAIDDLNTSGEY
jgi:hypothetical protein